jgi:urocanate hydratase
MKKVTDLEELVREIKKAKNLGEGVSIGFLGNIVALWERLA